VVFAYIFQDLINFVWALWYLYRKLRFYSTVPRVHFEKKSDCDFFRERAKARRREKSFSLSSGIKRALKLRLATLKGKELEICGEWEVKFLTQKSTLSHPLRFLFQKSRPEKVSKSRLEKRVKISTRKRLKIPTQTESKSRPEIWFKISTQDLI
jgi:hypothetical protein